MTETEVASEVVETPNVDTPSTPETVQDSSSTAVEQQTETPTLEAPKPEAEAPTWEGFELKAPEGSDGETVTAFAKAMQDNGMSPDGAQKALGELAQVMADRQMADLNATHEGWIAESKADKLIGGDKFDENMAIAKKAAEAFGDAELQTLLKPVSDGGQGLGNHPAISFGCCSKLARRFRSDTSTVSGSAPVTEEESAAQGVFDKSDMN